jgi:hypothetical protein
MCGADRLPYYKRKVPAALRAPIGRSTFTANLGGPPGSREFRRAHDLSSQAEVGFPGPATDREVWLRQPPPQCLAHLERRVAGRVS